jgi:subtilisin-like proprotein convertase family protein
LPAGITASYDQNPTLPGGLLDLSLAGFSAAAVAAGTYTLTLTGTSADGTITETLTVEKSGGDGGSGPFNLAASGTVDDIRPILTANDNREGTFEFQVAGDSDFTDIVFSSTGNLTPQYTLPDYLAPNAVYFWRVRLVGGCGLSMWSESSFMTGDCRVINSLDAAVPISDGPPTQTATMTVDVPTNQGILDLDVYRVDVRHTWIGDLEIDLVAPNGDIANLFDRSCGGLNDILASFDDESNTTLDCPPVNGEFLAPAGAALSAFDGRPAGGTWTLRVRDRADDDGGELRGFALKVCLAEASLPVDLISFNATGLKDHIALEWATAREENNFGFYVERSVANFTGWTELGFVAPGTAYRFDDRTAQPLTDYVYRLRQQDLDGRVNYSELRTARIGTTAKALRLFPNPTSGVLNYRITAADGLRYTLTDVNGRVLGCGQLNGTVGTIKLEKQPAGIYLLRAGGETYRVVRL